MVSKRNKLDITEVKARFKIVHKDSYCYSKYTEYTGMLVPITIVCPIHGDFLQRPADHCKGQKCPKCAAVTRKSSQTSSLSVFVKKAELVHDSKYDYSTSVYINSRTKLNIICRVHGVFTKTPNKHLEGQGCAKCANSHRRTQKDFIKDASSVHGVLYDYSKSVYVAGDTNITITCKVHGDFQQTPYSHIKQKCGCPQCASYGFDKTKPAILYYLSINNGQAYKIGITNRTVTARFDVNELKSIKVIKTWNYTVGADAYSKEQSILKAYTSYKYLGTPLLKSGNTELFSKDVLELE